MSAVEHGRGGGHVHSSHCHQPLVGCAGIHGGAVKYRLWAVDTTEIGHPRAMVCSHTGCTPHVRRVKNTWVGSCACAIYCTLLHVMIMYHATHARASLSKALSLKGDPSRRCDSEPLCEQDHESGPVIYVTDQILEIIYIEIYST